MLSNAHRIKPLSLDGWTDKLERKDNVHKRDAGKRMLCVDRSRIARCDSGELHAVSSQVLTPKAAGPAVSRTFSQPDRRELLRNGYASWHGNSPRSITARLHPKLGFDKVPMDSVVDDNSMSMSEMKALYHQWLSTYDFEQKQFSSLAVWTEIVLTQAFKATAGCTTPHPLRTAVCCMLLEKISNIFGSFEKVLKTVSSEIFSALYCDYHTPPELPPLSPNKMAQVERADEGKVEAPVYINMHAYSQLHAELKQEYTKYIHRQEHLLQEEISQKAMLSRELDASQRFILRLFMRSWKSVTWREQQSLYDLCESRRMRTAVRNVFMEWRRVTEVEKVERLRKAESKAAKEEREVLQAQVIALRTSLSELEKWKSEAQDKLTENSGSDGKALTEARCELQALKTRNATLETRYNAAVAEKKEIAATLAAAQAQLEKQQEALGELQGLLQCMLRQLGQLDATQPLTPPDMPPFEMPLDQLLDAATATPRELVTATPRSTDLPAMPVTPQSSALQKNRALSVLADRLHLHQDENGLAPGGVNFKREMSSMALSLAATERPFVTLLPLQNRLQGMNVERFLLSWINHIIRVDGKLNRVVTNFGRDVSDCECYAAVMSWLWPGAVPMDRIMDSAIYQKRAKMLLQVATAKGMHPFCAANDIAEANPQLNLAFTAWIFEASIRSRPFSFASRIAAIPADWDQLVRCTRDLWLTAWETNVTWDLVVDHVRAGVQMALVARVHEVDQAPEPEEQEYYSDFNDFTKLASKAWIRDEFDSHEIQELEDLLEKKFVELKRTYTYYASQGTASNDSIELMSRWEFGRLMEQGRVLDLKKLPRTAVDAAYTKCAVKEYVMPNQFAEMLFCLANHRHKELKSPAERFGKLWTDIDTNVHVNDISGFLKLVASQKVQSVVNQYQKSMYKVFTQYCGLEAQDASAQTTVCFREFIKFIQDMQFFDGTFSHNMCQTLFNTVQVHKTDETQEGELSFREFQDLLVAVALFKVPNPMLPPHIRIREFFCTLLPDRYKVKWPKIKLDGK